MESLVHRHSLVRAGTNGVQLYGKAEIYNSCIVCFLLFDIHIANAQQIKADTTLQSKTLIPAHSPTVAGVSSAIIPGAGQIYNHKYWKVPLIYAGLATSCYFIYYNYTIYSNFRDAYIARIDGDTSTNISSFNVWYVVKTTTFYLDGYSTDQLLSVQETYRRYLDIAALFTVGIYFLNILDAVVDAHLYHFDVSNNLTLDWQPSMNINPAGRWNAGLALTLNFK